MRKNRSRLQITVNVLEALAASDVPLSAASLKQKANVSWLQFQDIISKLLQMRFVTDSRNDSEQHIHCITPSGREIIHKYYEFKKDTGGIA